MSGAGSGEADLVAVHVLVRGVVQGVFFRETMRREADAAEVCGWVRNLGDGRVEALVEGSRSGVDSVVDWCRRGPRRAVVTEIEVSDVPASGITGFRVRHD
ncbi:MAG: acylphosphatase [Acidimicrobiia bacterium]|nr:acylphosphatase [Acidimicrobiia bacterium]